jgi:hypothetical protein
LKKMYQLGLQKWDLAKKNMPIVRAAIEDVEIQKVSCAPRYTNEQQERKLSRMVMREDSESMIMLRMSLGVKI